MIKSSVSLNETPVAVEDELALKVLTSLAPFKVALPVPRLTVKVPLPVMAPLFCVMLPAPVAVKLTAVLPTRLPLRSTPPAPFR